VVAEFRITRSEKGYCVQLYRRGELYVTFLGGLTRESAEREAERLRIFWHRIQSRRAPSSKRALLPDQLLA